MNEFLITRNVKDGIKLMIPVLDSNKNITLCSTVVGALNDITFGLLFIAVVVPDSAKQKLIFVTEEGFIYGFSKLFAEEYGILKMTRLSELIPEVEFLGLTLESALTVKMVLRS